MSTRQRKRLALQQQPTSGQPGGVASSEDDALPDTMLRPQQHSRRKQRRKAAAGMATATPSTELTLEEEEEEDATTRSAPTNRIEPEPPAEKVKDPKKGNKRQQQPNAPATRGRGARSSGGGGHPKSGRTAGDVDDYELQLLEQAAAVLRGEASQQPSVTSSSPSAAKPQRKRQANNSSSRKKAEGRQEEVVAEEEEDHEEAEEDEDQQQQQQQEPDERRSCGTSPPPSLIELLQANRALLDPRGERIKSFGAGSVESLKPRHPQCPKFKPSPLASADPNAWPRYDNLGMELRPLATTGSSAGNGRRGKGSSPLGGLTIYSLDVSSPAFVNASTALRELTASATGDVNAILSLVPKYPYHLPLLAQLHRTFILMGERAPAQQYLDMALYALGMILSPVLGKSAAVAMLRPEDPATTMALEILGMGAHSALRKGCAKAALELAKTMLSIDSTDSQRVALLLDYIGIRASAFELVIAIHAIATTTAAAEPSAEEGPTQGDPRPAPVFGVAALPSWGFNAALAAFLRHSMESKAAEEKKKAQGASSALQKWRPVSAAVEDRGTTLLRAAVLRFPSAAAAVADRAGLSLRSAPWSTYLDEVMPVLERQGADAGFDGKHAVSLFAERSAELWKMPSAAEFLASTIGGVVAAFTADSAALLEEQTEALRTTGAGKEGALARFRVATVDEVMGKQPPAIPQELLAPEATPDELRADAQRNDLAGLTAQEQDEVARMEAAFGALPTDIPLDHRRTIWEDMLQERVAQLGQDRNAVTLFLQTILPWNTPRQMALRQALEDAGVVDPAAELRRQRRDDAARGVEDLVFADDDDNADAPEEEEDQHQR